MIVVAVRVVPLDFGGVFDLLPWVVVACQQEDQGLLIIVAFRIQTDADQAALLHEELELELIHFFLQVLQTLDGPANYCSIGIAVIHQILRLVRQILQGVLIPGNGIGRTLLGVLKNAVPGLDGLHLDGALEFRPVLAEGVFHIFPHGLARMEQVDGQILRQLRVGHVCQIGIFPLLAQILQGHAVDVPVRGNLRAELRLLAVGIDGQSVPLIGGQIGKLVIVVHRRRE